MVGPRELSAGLTLAIGAAGGLVARALHLPLPMLLGALVVTALLAVANWRPLGHPVWAPSLLRLVFVPVIGVSIGATFTVEVIHAAAGWWPSILALAVYIPLAHQIAFRITRASGLTDPVTAWFGTAPGGFVEAIEMGQARNADVRVLTSLQFLRLVLTIVLVPLLFTWVTGHAVGSGAGLRLGNGVRLDWVEVPWLVAAGFVGAVLGLRLRLPAGLVLGPVVMSALVHLAGFAHAAPPAWLIAVTQVAIGVTLGARFAGMQGRLFLRSAGVTLVAVAAVLVLAGVFALGLSRLMGQPVAGLFLAFAPGGLAEMTLIALSLHVSVIFVTTHHLLRIFLTVFFARLLAGRMLARR